MYECTWRREREREREKSESGIGSRESICVPRYGFVLDHRYQCCSGKRERLDKLLK